MQDSGLRFGALPLEGIIEEYKRKFPLREPTEAATELAFALAQSPLLRNSEHLIAVRNSPASMVFVADAGQPEPEMLNGLDEQIKGTLDRTRYVDWSGIDNAVDATARRLVEELGAGFISQAEFKAIPRGGHVVLGLLSYRLGLSAEQTRGMNEGRKALILVDDCALSGLRFKEALSSIDDRQVVLATLFSPAPLRAAIEKAEAAVVACVSGVDLIDFAEVMSQEQRKEWVERWRDRGEIYWTGQPEHLVFPWGETDLGMWNPSTSTVEPGWQIGPPSLRLAKPDSDHKVQLVDPGTGSLGLAPRVLYASLGHDIGVFDLDTSTAWHLEGTAADMWKAILGSLSLKDAAQDIAKRAEVELESVEEDLRLFADELVSKGLLFDRGLIRNGPTEPTTPEA